MNTKIRIPNPVDTVSGGISAFDDLASTIAAPPTGRPLAAAIGRSGQLFCDAVGSKPGQFLSPFLPGSLVTPLLCKPYWDSKNYGAPIPAPTFTGGQCGVRYRVDGTFVSSGNNTGATCGTTRTWRSNSNDGPISGVLLTFNPNNVVIQNGSGFKSPIYDLLTSASLVASQVCAAAANGSIRASSITITSVTRIDGQPDNCGNPPPGAQPGTNPPPVPTFPPGAGPGQDPDGQPFFFVPPIGNPVPTYDPIPVPEPLPGEPGGPAGGPGGEGGPPGGTAGPGGTTGPGEDAEGEADEGEELVALKIDITQFPVGAREIAPGLYRAVCYVFMGNSEGLDLDPAGSIMGDGQLVLAERDRLTRWRVSANIGYVLNVTPYYRTIEP